MPFDPHTALRYAAALARPRRVGTPENAAAINSLASQLSGFGWTVQRQPFTFSSAASRGVALLILVIDSLILLTLWAWDVSAWLAAPLALALLVLVAGAPRVLKAVAAASLAPGSGAEPTWLQRACQRLGPHYTTENVIAARPGSFAAGTPHVLLVAHSDSKSQPMPLVTRMALMLAGGAAAAGFALLTLLRPALPDLTAPAAVAGLLAIVAGLPVMLMYLAEPGNLSPGAIDNASGAGLVLHLAEHLGQSPPRLPVTVLITGAEEMGTLGAHAYLRAAEAARTLPDPAATYILNFDGVGTAGRLSLAGPNNGRLAGLARQAAATLGFGLGSLPVAGALYDHIPFAEWGYDAVTLSVVGTAARAVHTPADTVKRLNAAGFRQAGLLALEVLVLLEAEARTA